MPQTGTDQDSVTSGSSAGLQIAEAIADEKGMPEIQRKVPGRLQ